MLISDIEILAQLCDEESVAVTGGLQRVEGDGGGSWEGGPRPVYSGPIDPNTTNKTNEFLEEAGMKFWEIGCEASLLGDVLGICGIVADEARKG